MCILIDANSAHKMDSKNPDGLPVLKWILRGKGKVVVSPQLLAELNATKFSELLRVLDQAGKICRFDSENCDVDAKNIQLSGKLKSNDSHVLALIRVSGCELVFTHDKLLHEDIKNKEIVNKSCKIYQNESHASLLGECHC